jgi:excisionase family DNA binding protein
VAYLTVYRWIQAGKLTAYQVEKQYRINKTDFDAFMQSYKVHTRKK